MGGFKLIGERYVIQSTAPVVCYCQGFVGEIDGITERRLASKSTKVLDPHEDLPVPLRGSFLRQHTPDDMSYQVSPRGVDDVILGEKETDLAVDGYGSSALQFATIQ